MIPTWVDAPFIASILFTALLFLGWSLTSVAGREPPHP